MIESIALNGGQGYYPQFKFTSLAVNTYTSVIFERVVNAIKQGGHYYYPVDVTQLLKDSYYTMKEVKKQDTISLTGGHFNYLYINYDEDYKEEEGHNNNNGTTHPLVVDPRYDHIATDIVDVRLRQFVSKIFMKPNHNNWNHLISNNESICLSINVNFGKTFLTCVPDDMTKEGVSVSMDKLHAQPYGGKVGLRPKFLSHLVFPHRSILSTVATGWTCCVGFDITASHHVSCTTHCKAFVDDADEWMFCS